VEKEGDEQMIKFLKRFAKKIEKLSAHEVGIEEGEHCNRSFCRGMIHVESGVCCCSTSGNPPCSYCTDANHYCDTCGWEE
jgi:hypothetical protein